MDERDPICPLCKRPIPKGAKQSLHHLVPVLKGGKHGATVLLHQICHNEIHAALTEAQIAREFNTIDALLDQERIAKFVMWVQKKDPAFHSRSYGNHRKRHKTRR